jgi:hypothetical protein
MIHLSATNGRPNFGIRQTQSEGIVKAVATRFDKNSIQHRITLMNGWIMCATLLILLMGIFLPSPSVAESNSDGFWAWLWADEESEAEDDPYVAAMIAIAEHDNELLGRLLSDGLSVKSTLPDGTPFVIAAAIVGNLDAVKLLLESGESAFVVDANGVGLWHVAVLERDIELLVSVVSKRHLVSISCSGAEARWRGRSAFA